VLHIMMSPAASPLQIVSWTLRKHWIFSEWPGRTLNGFVFYSMRISSRDFKCRWRKRKFTFVKEGQEE
jgi:hypothetical protein